MRSTHDESSSYTYLKRSKYAKYAYLIGVLEGKAVRENEGVALRTAQLAYLLSRARSVAVILLCLAAGLHVGLG
jgi:hypothetical protein